MLSKRAISALCSRLSAFNGRKRYSTNPVRPATSVGSSLSQRRARRQGTWLASLGIVASGLALFKGISVINDYLDESGAPEEKEKMVVLGSGWAAMSLVYGLNLFRYDVTLVSPRNYFLFTPLLADAAVGSVPTDSIIEPIRNFSHGGGFQFVEATATDIDPKEKTVTCETVVGKQPLTLSYDKLIVAVGSTLNDQGVKGVKENAVGLRDLQDAARIRNTVIDCLERANSSLASEAEKERLLHFVVVGGSAIASEAAAELHDYVASNIASHYPDLQKYFKVSVIDSKEHVHNFYDKSISQEMRRYCKRSNVHVITDAKVNQVDKNSISYTVVEGDKPTQQSLPFGLCIWSTGTSIHPLVQKLRSKIEGQTNERALVCDLSLRVQGTEDIFALGDCATVDQGTLLKKWADVFKAADTNNDGTIDLDEYRVLMKDLARTYPALRAMDDRVFAMVDENNDKILTADEFKNLLTYMERTLTRFPATATVAAQQGEFLAYNLNKGNYDAEEEEEGKADDDGDDDDDEGPVFRYKHIGGYEYVGAEDGFVERGSKGQAIVSGPGAMWLWRAAYFSRVMSNSMRLDILWNWLHSNIFGSQPTRM